MKLAVSTIGWRPLLRDSEAVELFVNLGVQGIEVAPTTVWSDLSNVSHKEVDTYRAMWTEHGLKIVALQSLLFGKPELQLFGTETARKKTIEYLTGVMDMASGLEANVLVFGSPGNRKRGSMPLVTAQQIAIEAFTEIGERASQRDLRFCIEPNPHAYGCDFITNAKEGLELVQTVNHPGFGLHLDTGSMTLSNETIGKEIVRCGDTIRHWHVSEPHLAPPSDASVVEHSAAAEALARIRYDEWISIEMLQPGDASPHHVLETAIRVTKDRYEEILS